MAFATALAAQGKGRPMPSHHIQERHGLSCNIVNAICQDRHGFLWVATFDGLNRFDGTHFKIYKNNRGDSTSLLNNTVHDVVEDREGNLWCVTNGGVSCLKAGTDHWAHHKPAGLVSPAGIANALCDRQGVLWFSGSDGLFRFAPQTKAWDHFKADPADPGSLSNTGIVKKGMLEDPAREGIWLATIDGLNYFDTRSFKATHARNRPEDPLFTEHLVSALAKSHQGHLLLADNTARQVIRFDPTTQRIASRYPLTLQGDRFAISALFEDRSKQVWVSEWGYNVFKIDAVRGTCTQIASNGKSDGLLAGQFFWCIYEDAEHTLWAGTVNGISCWNEGAAFYKTYDFPHITRTVAQAEDGAWWVGFVGGGGVCRLDPATGQTTYFRQNIGSPDDYVHTLAWQGKNCWAGTEKGLFRLKAGGGFFQPVPGPLEGGGAVFKVLPQGDSLLWAYWFEKGFFALDVRTGQWQTFRGPFPQSAKPPPAHALFKDHLGYPLFFYADYQFAVYDPTTRRYTLDSIPDLRQWLKNGGVLYKLCADARYWWLACKGVGLFRFDRADKRLEAWTESEGLAFNHVMDCAADRQGRIWAASYTKMSVFDPAKAAFQNYAFPLSEDDYRYINALVPLRDGHLLGVLGQHLVEIDPERYPGTASASKPLLHNLLVYGVEKTLLGGGGTLRLEPNENNFTLQYGLLSGLQSKAWKFQYRLPPFYPDWIDHGQNTGVTFTNVPGGQYTFEVRASALDGTWASPAATLSLIIVPPFYRTDGFQFAVALLAALAIAGILRLRINKIRRAAQEKSDFDKRLNEWRLKALRAQMNPHFIFNCMNSIDHYILRHDTEKASFYLNKFARLVRLILHHSDESHIPLEHELEMLHYYVALEAMRFETPFQFHVQVAPGLDPAEIEIPSMLLQPYLENAILHGLRPKKGGLGRLDLDIQESENALLCTIADNGVGRGQAAASADVQRKGHVGKGLKLTEERLLVLQEETHRTTLVEITDLFDENGHPNGTKVVLTIPIQH